MSFEESSSILQEVTSVFRREDDLTTLQNIIRIHGECKRSAAQQQQELKDTIRELTRRTRKCEAEATRAEPKSAHHKRLQTLATERLLLEESLHRTTTENDELRAELEQAERESQDLQERQQSIEVTETVEQPRVRHALSLYANITNIRWDYDSDNVKGYVALPNAGDLRPFDFDSRSATRFQIANQLWDLLTV